jgi:hypothetical protein
VVPWVVGGAVRRIVRLPIRRVDWHVRVSEDHGTRTVQLRDEKFRVRSNGKARGWVVLDGQRETVQRP